MYDPYFEHVLFRKLRFLIISLVLCLDLLSTPLLPQQNASAYTQHISHFQLRILLLIKSLVFAKRVGAEMMSSVQI